MFETPPMPFGMPDAVPTLFSAPELTTDTLHVKLPPGMEVQTAASIFQRYGDIAHIGAIPGAKFNMVVGYYDVRSAAALEVALGDGCQAGAEMNCRTVKMPGNMEIDPQYICNVIDVFQDEDGDGYTIKFYDSRTAQHLQEFVDMQCLQEAYYGEAPAAPPSRPAQVFPFLHGPCERKKSEEEAESDGDDQACDVQLTGMSEALCNGPCLQAMFEQAGLKGCVQRCGLRRGGPDGPALIITLNSQRSARRCVRHFGGRRWGVEGGVEVTATMCEVPVSVPTSEQASEHGEQEDGKPTADSVLARKRAEDDSTTACNSEASD